MKNQTLKLISLLLLTVVTLTSAKAQDDSSTIFPVVGVAPDLVSGTWSGSITGDSYVTYHLKMHGAKVSGIVVSGEDTTDVYDGKVTGENIEFKVSVNGVIIPHEGKVVMNNLTMRIMIQDKIVERRFFRVNE